MIVHISLAKDLHNIDENLCTKLINEYKALIKQITTLSKNWKTFK